MVLVDGTMISDDEKAAAADYCRDYIRGSCLRENCRYAHETPPVSCLKELFRFCHDYQNKGCFRLNCKFLHSTSEEEAHFYMTGFFRQGEPRERGNISVCQAYLHGSCCNSECKMIHPVDKAHDPVLLPPPLFNQPHPMLRDENSPPESKVRRYTYEDVPLENQVLSAQNMCQNCESLEHKVKLLHDNISVLLNKVADLTEKNGQLTSMNEFLLQQTSANTNEQSCIITSRHGTSAPVSLATVSMTPVVSLSGALPTLVPAAATPNLALAPASSRAQLLTPAPQLLTVSTTQQLMGNSGALIVTSAGAQQLMHVSDSGTLMGGGQTVVAVTPAQLTLAPPPQQLIGNASQTTVQQLVQQSAQQLAQQQQFTAQQSVQHLAAQQSAQHLAAQQTAQHLAAQQSAQHLAAQQSQQLAQQSAQQLAAQQVPSAQQLVHQTATQQITISSTSQAMALSNSQNQPLTFPIISQSILPH